jgi:hypothetical protein
LGDKRARAPAAGVAVARELLGAAGPPALREIAAARARRPAAAVMAAAPRVLVAVLPGAVAPVAWRGTVLAAEAAWAVPRETPDVAAWVAAAARAVAGKSVAKMSFVADRLPVETAATS